MKILDLTSLERSEVKYKISKFPDGQQDVIIEPFVFIEWKEAITNNTFKVQIKSRFNSFKDLELIICATKALRRLGVKEIHLYIPYLLGARSDRQFVEGGTSYLVDIVAPIINAQNYESVTVYDVHSDVASACINNLKIIDNINLVKWFWHQNPTKGWGNYILCSPDAGSLKKIYKAADAVGYKNDILVCSKYRDTEGKLSRVNVPLNIPYKDVEERDIVIIDDICDGGRTFINIAKEIKNNKQFCGKIYLIVSHGIFSAGFDELGEYFDGIFCTNSYSNAIVPKRYDPLMIEETNFIFRQMNIF